MPLWSKARALAAAAQRYSGNFAVYFVLGGCCALIEWTAFAIALRFIGYITAALIGFAVGTLANYWLSRKLAFVRRDVSTYEELARIYAVSGFAMAVNLGAMIALVELAGLPPLAAKILGTGCGFFFNFCGRQFWVFAPVPRHAGLWQPRPPQ